MYILRYADNLLMLSFGRNGTGPAWAPGQRFVRMPDFGLFSNSLAPRPPPVDQRPLHLFHQNTYHHKAFENLFPILRTTRPLLAIVVDWVLYECVAHLLCHSKLQ
jgi:hypothetical protein